MVTSCSQSHGERSARVTMSQVTVTVKPVIATPQTIISARSMTSSARHFRWRWASRTRAMAPPLLHGANQPEHLDGVRSEILGDLVLHRRGDALEAGLVDLVDDLHAHLLQLGARFALELEGLLRLLRVHLVRRPLYPLLLLGGEARPQLVADEEDRMVRLVLGHRHDRRHLVVLVQHIDGVAVL